MIKDKWVVFTGKMETGSREDMMALVEKNGGKASNHVTKDTNILVVGSYRPSAIKGDVSGKNSLANKYNKRGSHIAIMTEKEFLLEL